MNNKPIAWIDPYDLERLPHHDCWVNGQEHKNSVPLYTHPVKDREKDRLRFSDEAFNRWLDESISDSGHTVYDLVENVCEAWHGWENSQYYTHPAELTDEEIVNLFEPKYDAEIDDEMLIDFARAILRKAQEKC